MPAVAQGNPLCGSFSGQLRRSRGEFLDSVSSDSCHGGAQQVSEANLSKKMVWGGLAMNTGSSLLARPIGCCFTAGAVSSCPTAGYCYCWCCLYCVYCVYCCGRLKLSDDHALRLLLYCCGRLKLSDDHALRVLLLLLLLLPVLLVLLWPSQAVRRPGTAVRVSPKRKQLHLPRSGEANRSSFRTTKI